MCEVSVDLLCAHVSVLYGNMCENLGGLSDSQILREYVESEST